MPYDKKAWLQRLAERTDLSSQVVHLTRETNTQEQANVLYEIVDGGVIKGSVPSTGFICGNVPAVCFQDAPLASICQNVYFEQKYREQNPSSKLRYRATGLAFSKPSAYAKGARPVLYEQTTTAKNLLPKSEWWRIVNFDLTNHNALIDWTHEREWRSPEDFKFSISEATLLFVNSSVFKKFAKICASNGKDYVGQARGVVVLDNILY